MLSVRLPAGQLEPRLPPELAIASSNGPRLCVAAGPTEAVTRLQQQLEAEGVVCKPLHTSHAFHSPMMDPAIEPFAALVRAVKLSPPKLPFVSTTTARLITDEEATDPGYWAAHLRRTVHFAEAIAEVWTEPDRVLLEVGPRTTLATLARQQVGDKSRQFAVSSLGDGADDEAEWTALLGAVGQLWLAGVSVDARAFFALEQRRRVPLPTYPFERQRHWLESPGQARVPVEETIVAAPVAVHPGKVIVMENQSAERTNGHKAGVMARLRGLLEEASGIDFAAADPSITFLELGLDSLFLTQIALSLKRQFGVTIGFRQLLEELSTLDRLADRIVATLPAEAPVVASPALPPPAAPLATPAAMPGTIQALVEQQLRIMQQQLEVLSGRTSVEEKAHPAPAATETSAASPYLDGDEPAKPMTYDVKKAFGAIARIHTAREELPPRQKARLDELVTRYTARTQKSKAWTQEHRAPLADPRVVTGFRPLIKELVYPVVCTRSAGARLWDLDGNEYVDALNGFGSNFLGHASPVVTDAIKTQVDLGFEIGPMQPFVGDCARLVCELTGHDRAAFCNTGSEAVMGAMRVARTVTGRNLIVVFSGSYHGIFDEVIVRGTKRLRSVPAAPGIMPESVENVLVLDYGTPESLALIKERAGELAAVMVEPVQSRRPDFRPVEFLRELRAVTEQAGCAYIWDEVITGFRIHPGGAQAHFGVQADLATYGKVVSGGLPMGVIAGRKQWMDALDGGFWQFGDDSVPTAGVTYFAGTFVRHPLAMIATKATLEHLKQAGPALQEALNARTDRLARELNAYCEAVKAPVKIKHFGSLWKAFHVEDHPMQDLLFVYLRARGIHIWDGFPCFLSEAHGEAEVDLIVTAFKESVAEMQEAGFYPPPAQNPELPVVLDASRPPLPDARLGRDPSGNPAWYVPNPREAGKYLKLEAK
jgi:glutamate-1-semialdehyde aminotransferase/acyl carrier protein